MEIGLLEFRPPFSDALNCALSVVTLKNGPPPFIALSYEWGTDDSNHVMSVDGHDISIRHNLWLALETIMKHHPRLVEDCRNHHQRLRQELQNIHCEWGVPDVAHPTDSLFIWADARLHIFL
ncbi:uncharacterized protein BDZ99DRAFT_461415 [Mytilinidion resinicola]|uniref:Heterokaryon incompatibility domain-containing protein n=1 Tax=Mytilinidion resinicola TaxID=574789 RepID=A0A6A6YRY4_9PEZI|nr:uncharacterized protein BDZ99DRAFT_461415 [Mytilinidion resinicola]KAF2811318.1 hypothetical protein BDZ99DRAFT_461415 [Mytilinidion resinicola]